MDEVGNCRRVRSAVSGFQSEAKHSLINCRVTVKVVRRKGVYRDEGLCARMVSLPFK